MSECVTKILHEAEGQPTILELPLGFSAIVFRPDGELDLALWPDVDSATLDKEEFTGDVMANQGMMEVAAWLIAMQDPEVRALVERKINQDNPKA